MAEEDIVVTITHGGYVKRTKTEDYRSQKRGGVDQVGGEGQPRSRPAPS
ncbi:DNA gyrase C-terminal beta-propeller domain-containing protein [Streptomyces sp. NPDC031705]